MANELAKAITKIIYPPLKAVGFLRIRRPVLLRVENGIVQSLWFQASGWGGRDFCVTASANLIAGNEIGTLQPGFRLSLGADGGEWLPSLTPEEAAQSAQVTLESIQSQALPYFENIRTVPGFSALLAHERWGADHHLNFQRGVAAALAGDAPGAQRYLEAAIRLYQEDGRDWCGGYMEKARALQEALTKGNAAQLLADWERSNSKAHGLG